MTEKEKVILRHSQLALEYSRLANSDHTLPIEEWNRINARMNEILKEIEELKAVESQWEEMEKSSYISANEVAKTLGVSQSKAYEIIRNLNADLKKQGYITLAGRVSRAYFNEKWYGSSHA